jgi:hypothetical protein
VAVIDDLERDWVLPRHERHQIFVGESLQILYFHIWSSVGHRPGLPYLRRLGLSGSA